MNLKRRILLVSNGFYPEISPRSYRAVELAKEFVRQGHEVSVISKHRDFDYSGFLKEYPMTFKMWGKPFLPTVPDFRVKPFSYLSRALFRILSLYFEYPGIEEMYKVRRMLRYEDGYDMVISFAVPYPVHWGVAMARRGKHKIAAKWIADCGDPYMGDVLDSFRKPFYFAFFEKSFCRKSDFISIPVESAKPGYYQEFHNKIRIIPQGFNFEITERVFKEPENEIPTFAYAGSFLPGARDPKPLVKYLETLEIPFRFLVYTNRPEFMDEFREKLKNKLFVRDYIPRAELMKILASMDFLINFDNNTTLNSPSKLIDYAITGRPVLNIESVFREADLLDFLEGDYGKRMPLPDPEGYHIKNISKLFLKLLE